jgi:hypothetical protein
MSKTAVSIFVFGIYLIALGIILNVAPNIVLRPLGAPPPTDAWVHIAGGAVFMVGCLYVAAAREEVLPFFRWTIWGRTIVATGFVIFTLLHITVPGTLVFGLIDLIGASCTAILLRVERGRPTDE